MTTIEITGGLPAHLIHEIYAGLDVLRHADEINEAQVEANW